LGTLFGCSSKNLTEEERGRFRTETKGGLLNTRHWEWRENEKKRGGPPTSRTAYLCVVGPYKWKKCGEAHFKQGEGRMGGGGESKESTDGDPL